MYKLEQELNPSLLQIRDDSRKHAGHAAMKGLNPSETHFAVSIVSSAFEKKPLVQRHKLVYSILDQEMKAGLHALQLQTKTPAEWEKLNQEAQSFE
jgi:stress-induced morphogen